MMYELNPIYSSRKSFYGKAKIMTGQDDFGAAVYTLVSYGTPVLAIRKMDGNYYVIRLWDSWSATTGRHVNEFALQILGRSLFKKEWDAMRRGYTYKMTSDRRGFIDI